MVEIRYAGPVRWFRSRTGQTTAMMMRAVCVAVGISLAACGGGEVRTARADSAGGAVNAPPRAPAGARSRPENHLGRIPILEYHVVGDSTRGEFIISREKFQHDLQLLYDRGYRPI